MRGTDRARVVAKEIQLEDSGRLGPVFFHSEVMAPFIHDGDLLIVEPVTWDEVRAGDIVTYRNGERFPTYRVLRKRQDSLTVEPDNWPARFEVPREDLLGRVVERRRGDDRIARGGWRWKWYSRMILARYYCRRVGGPVKRMLFRAAGR